METVARSVKIRGGFESFRVGDRVKSPTVTSHAPSGAEVGTLSIPGVVVATHADHVIVCQPTVGALSVVYNPAHLEIVGRDGNVAGALSEYARIVAPVAL